MPIGLRVDTIVFRLLANVVNVLLVFFIIYKGTQAEGSFFILRLVTGFGTFYQDFLYYSGVGVLPVVAQAYSDSTLFTFCPPAPPLRESVHLNDK